MSDDGSTKDDVKLPDGEVGDKIDKLFNQDSKDTSMFGKDSGGAEELLTTSQTLLSLLPWVKRLLLMPRKLPRVLRHPLQVNEVGQTRVIK